MRLAFSSFLPLSAAATTMRLHTTVACNCVAACCTSGRTSLCRYPCAITTSELRHCPIATLSATSCPYTAKTLKVQNFEGEATIGRRCATSSAAAELATTETDEDFFATKGVTFATLGLHPAVAESLTAAGYRRPTQVQELAMPHLLAGNDVVLAAETGSGKTLAYLAPVISLLLQQHGSMQAGKTQTSYRPGALVLCPNAALCEQVTAVVNAMLDPGGKPLARAAYVASNRAPPLQPPDITVCTPAGLMALAEHVTYDRSWTKAGIVERMACVVLDEADALMSGSYERDSQRILEAMQLDDGDRRAAAICSSVGLSQREFLELPRAMRKAAEAGDVAALRNHVRRLRADDARLLSGSATDPSMVPEPPSGGPAETPTVGDEVGAAPRPPATRHEEADGDAARPLEAERASSGARAGVSGQPAVSEPAIPRLWKRQYVFVAATMPADSKLDVAASIRRKFPAASWLEGRQLHQTARRLSLRWLQTDPAAWRQALQDVVSGDQQLQRGKGKMLVFARDCSGVDEAAEALEASGFPVMRYHKDVPQKERARALAALTQDTGVVLVCTDAAARGIDIPNITHIVQADFANDAVTFLHRVGRTARAGREGKVTSLYMPENQHLADALRRAIEAGEPLEGAFSRKRSFSKKFKRYGRFVPRGERG